MFSLPELFVSFCSLPLLYLQAVGSIETLPHKLFLWLCGSSYSRFFRTLTYLHHFFCGSNRLRVNDWQYNYEMKCGLLSCHNVGKNISQILTFAVKIFISKTRKQFLSGFLLKTVCTGLDDRSICLLNLLSSAKGGVGFYTPNYIPCKTRLWLLTKKIDNTSTFSKCY